MKFHCVYCHVPVKNTNRKVKMCCLCDDDYRFLDIDDVLFGFHTDKIYLLSDGVNNVYDKKNLLPGLLNV